jgi:hypothetical protein
MWDFVMDKIGAGAGALRELRFPLPICIPSASPQSSSLSPEAGTIKKNSKKNGIMRWYSEVVTIPVITKHSLAK